MIQTKIIKIVITMERISTDLEKSPDPVVETINLIRSVDKIWYAESDIYSRKGLFPNELILATKLQELLKEYNGIIGNN